MRIKDKKYLLYFVIIYFENIHKAIYKSIIIYKSIVSLQSMDEGISCTIQNISYFYTELTNAFVHRFYEILDDCRQLSEFLLDLYIQVLLMILIISYNDAVVTLVRDVAMVTLWTYL